MKQAEALEILKMGHNAFITGAAGSGKTHLLNEYIEYLKGHEVVIGITASTGIAATHMGGMTIHAWSGLGIRDTLTHYDLESMEEKPYLWKRFENAHVLIIDEISMLHHYRLDLVEEIARFFKRNDKPFGGMQVVLCGDFFQLPPVTRPNERESHFAYRAESWESLDLKICYLEEQHRQNDPTYLEVLNAIRDNNVSEPILEHLRKRYKKKPVCDIEPTKLYTHNVDVDAENIRELEKLPGEYFEYRMEGKGKDNLVETLKKGCLAPETLRLKKGARVMIVKNSFDEKYANGTLGIVLDCTNYGITIQTTGGRTINIKPSSWKIEEDGKVKAEIIQYPLRLAWAITIHKSQGMSLDAAEVDLSQSFEKGMGYVALSRVRTLEGLSLHGMNKHALMINEEVFEIDKKFREFSRIHVEDLKNESTEDILKTQTDFIKRISKHTKKEKVDTTQETKNLLLEGKNISEIAKLRSLKETTIIDHVEKLLEQDPKLDLSLLKKSIPKDRLGKITDALKKGGADGGVYRLTPAKIILGADYSFEEIRIGRLFIKK